MSVWFPWASGHLHWFTTRWHSVPTFASGSQLTMAEPIYLARLTFSWGFQDIPNGPSEILQARRTQPDFPTLTVGRWSPTRVFKNKQIYRNPHSPLGNTNPESWINQLAGLGTMLKENCPTPDQLDSPETFKVKGRRKKLGHANFFSHLSSRGQWLGRSLVILNQVL